MKTRTCLKEATLMGYLEGLLSYKERERVEKHLSYCASCVEELVIANSLITGRSEINTVPATVTENALLLFQPDEATTTYSWSEKLGHLLGELSTVVSPVFSLWPHMTVYLPLLRGLAGSPNHDTFTLRKTFEDIDTEIDIEKTATDKCELRITFPQHRRLYPKVRVVLKKEEEKIFSDVTDGASLIFKNIEFGHYSLELFRRSITIGRHYWEIRNTQKAKP